MNGGKKEGNDDMFAEEKGAKSAHERLKGRVGGRGGEGRGGEGRGGEGG
jgi:hypothetical protein